MGEQRFMPDELYTQLRRLLGDMFSMDELHRFLRGHLGKPFTDSLPEKGVSSAAYAAQAADRLITRGRRDGVSFSTWRPAPTVAPS